MDGVVAAALDNHIDKVVADDWNYFKAGVYTQNNTGDADDFDQATFYRLENTHD
ncbi:MAG: polysaccharide lyase family 7 protein [Pseudomonadota bacterium]